MPTLLINAPFRPRRACVALSLKAIISSSHARRVDEVQVTVLRREINKWRNTDWNVQIPGEWRHLALAGGRVGGLGVSRCCYAHDDSAPGGTAFQTSGEKAETSVHARQPPRKSKGPVATGEERDLLKSSSPLSLQIEFKAATSLRAPVKPVHTDARFAFFWLKNCTLVLLPVLCLWIRFISLRNWS